MELLSNALKPQTYSIKLFIQTKSTRKRIIRNEESTLLFMSIMVYSTIYWKSNVLAEQKCTEDWVVDPNKNSICTLSTYSDDLRPLINGLKWLELIQVDSAG